MIPRTPIELRPQSKSKAKAGLSSVSRNLLQSFSRGLENEAPKWYYDVGIT